MDLEAKKLGSAIARQLYAMVQKTRAPDFTEQVRRLRNDHGVRTFTDEYVDKYLFGRKPRPGSELIRQKYGEG